MNTKSLCQIVTFAASIPAGMALRSTMRAMEHNKNNPSPDKYKPPIYSAIFGAVLGMVIQTVPYIAIQIARTNVIDKIELHSPVGTTKIFHTYATNYEPKSELEMLSNFTTARGLYVLATESFTTPKTVVEFHTSHAEQEIRVSQAYDGFLKPSQIAFTRPIMSETKEQLSDTEKAKLITLANYAIAKNNK